MTPGAIGQSAAVEDGEVTFLVQFIQASRLGMEGEMRMPSHCMADGRVQPAAHKQTRLVAQLEYKPLTVLLTPQTPPVGIERECSALVRVP